MPNKLLEEFTQELKGLNVEFKNHNSDVIDKSEYVETIKAELSKPENDIEFDGSKELEILNPKSEDIIKIVPNKDLMEKMYGHTINRSGSYSREVYYYPGYLENLIDETIEFESKKPEEVKKNLVLLKEKYGEELGTVNDLTSDARKKVGELRNKILSLKNKRELVHYIITHSDPNFIKKLSLPKIDHHHYSDIISIDFLRGGYTYGDDPKKDKYISQGGSRSIQRFQMKFGK